MKHFEVCLIWPILLVQHHNICNTCNVCMSQLQHVLQTYETFTMNNCNMDMYTCNLVQWPPLANAKPCGGSPLPGGIQLLPSLAQHTSIWSSSRTRNSLAWRSAETRPCVKPLSSLADAVHGSLTPFLMAQHSGSGASVRSYGCNIQS